MNPNVYNQQYPANAVNPQMLAGKQPPFAQNGPTPMDMNMSAMNMQINNNAFASAPPMPNGAQMNPASMHFQPGNPSTQFPPNSGQMTPQQQQMMLMGLQQLGISREQYGAFPPQQKQMIFQKIANAMASRGQHIQQQQPNNFPSQMFPQQNHSPFDQQHGPPFMNPDRPASAMGHMAPARPGTPGMSNQNFNNAMQPGMMPPARPGTAQGHRPPVGVGMGRPGTSMGMSGPNPMANGMGMGQPNMGMGSGMNSGPGMGNMGMMRPPSRSASSMGGPMPMGQGMPMGAPSINGTPSRPQHSPPPGSAGFPGAPFGHQTLDGSKGPMNAGMASPPPGSSMGTPQRNVSQSPRMPSASLSPAHVSGPPAPLNGMAGPPGLPPGGLGGDPGMSRPPQTQHSPRPPSASGPSGMINPAMRRPSTPTFPLNPQAASGILPGSSQQPMAPRPPFPSVVTSPQKLPNAPNGDSITTPTGMKVFAFDTKPVDEANLPSTSTLPPVTDTPSATGSAAEPEIRIVPQVPPLPANVKLDPSVTRVNIVPLAASDDTIPPLSEEEVKNIQEWMKEDKEYTSTFVEMRERKSLERREFFSSGRWWEKGGDRILGGQVDPRARREQFDVKYPIKLKRRKTKRIGFSLPRTVDKALASRSEQLVPIRLEFEVDHHKMRDTFVWNLNDPVITAEIFAQSVVDDYALTSNYISVIKKSIEEQLSEFRASYDNADVEPEPALCKGNLDDHDDVWWESWRKRLRTDSGFVKSGKRTESRRKARKGQPMAVEEQGEGTPTDGEDGDKPMTLDEFPIEDEDDSQEDMRILIRLDIIVGHVKLEDQFEWDLDNSTSSPEEFAEVYCKELGLGGEFKTAIAHSIREQVHAYQKSLLMVGYPTEGSLIQDEELRLSILPSLYSGTRPIDQVPSFTPLLNYMDDGDLDRNEKEREKDMNKRRKRTNRGRRGMALPDREPIRTCRTPANGFPEVDPATLAAANAAVTPVTSRRAAAAAASVNIANMVASENRDSDRMSPPPMQAASITPTPIPTAMPKEKKQKGLLKPPKIPSPLLRPRASVAAPTASTAVDVTTLPSPVENDPPPMDPVRVENKGPRFVTAKRAKELAREAKEKEFVEGQHPNMINGVWHCSNCGCPEGLAVGRRKGPLGDQSQCGPCGKFWHGHKRPKPVEYNPSYEYHKKLQEQPERSRKPRKRPTPGTKGLATFSEPPSEPQTPNNKYQDDENDTPVPSSQAVANGDKGMSPPSSRSSTPDAPLAEQVQVNGISHVTEASSSHPPSSSMDAPSSTTTQPTPPVSSNGTTTVPLPPSWLNDAMQEMQSRYPNDRFTTTRKAVNNAASPEWRIKCLDCPGKLYTPGPGESLTNFEVHLKNRGHRRIVQGRVQGTQDPAP